ncbi:MAG: Mrp/NBP35 family ATP-binding protein [Ruminococcaceae bacterium]|nr:Mrp/NBP35 family ATP-binding protein [Oscillospiraceae bacterium]
MSECSHDCSNCSANCSSREGGCGSSQSPESFLEKPHRLSEIKKVIGVVSGKGGVGKSMVTSMMAVTMNRRGYRSAILDADITGPSIPKMFGLTDKATADEIGIYPVGTKTDIGVMSVNLLLENDTDPVVWRGPVIAGAVKQFWTDVIWGDVDFMFVDMPPGTGDVPLTVFQSIPVDGIIVVTSPQELVSMIVGKAVKMADLMNVPVLGIVENMSYFECPDCGKKHKIYGESHIEEVAKEYGIKVISQLPIDPKLAAAADKGTIELFDTAGLENMADAVEK